MAAPHVDSLRGPQPALSWGLPGPSCSQGPSPPPPGISPPGCRHRSIMEEPPQGFQRHLGPPSSAATPQLPGLLDPDPPASPAPLPRPSAHTPCASRSPFPSHSLPGSSFLLFPQPLSRPPSPLRIPLPPPLLPSAPHHLVPLPPPGPSLFAPCPLRAVLRRPRVAAGRTPSPRCGERPGSGDRGARIPCPH
ncbi:uncharacterized protein LOC144576501 [Callithrix jacchus]